MTPSTPVARRAGRGVPLWWNVVALVLIPLLGVAVLAMSGVRTAWSQSASAARAAESVQEVAQLDDARNAVDQEVIPVLSLMALRSPSALAAFHLSSDQASAQAQQADEALRRTERASDRALALVPGASPSAPALRRAESALATARKQARRPSLSTAGIQQVYEEYLAVLGQLTTVQRVAWRRASAQNVSPATVAAVQDVQVVAQVSQSASREVPELVGVKIAASNAAANFGATHEAYLSDRARMQDLAQPVLQHAWQKLSRSAAITTMDGAAMASTGTSTGTSTTASAQQLTGLLAASAVRESALSTLLNTAVSLARGAADADRRAADAQRDESLGIALFVVIASSLAAIVIGRLTTRSLRQLAGQAQQISEGVLADVGTSGPREVRTVSTALASAVESLRRIQGQARAVSEGDLSNALLQEPLPGPLGEVVHASVQQIVASVRQREELQSALAHQAAHDPLTELPNRAQALRLVSSALHRAQRSGKMTGLLFIDLDGFKAINDGFGHATGDQVLREVSRRLQTVVRSGDVVCRLGGDEFVVVVEPLTSERDVVALAERLIVAVRAPIEAHTATGLQQVGVGASIGIAISQDGSLDGDRLFAQADAAVYRAKAAGRGRAELFDEALRAALASRAELEDAIAHALADGEMRLHYQPVMDLGTGHLHSYEALIRWMRPGHGMVSPDEFIPVAEQSQLICDLDRWVLYEATRQLQQWRTESPAAAGRPEPTIAVNISGRHLGEARVVTDVEDALAASGLPAHLLVLEVTETVLVDDPAAITHLESMRALGVSTAIDDFGTGYTSIGQLGHLPMDILKIDRSFIASDDPAHRSLVSLMIQAAHTFGLTVVAEGVEERDQLDQLRADSCDHVQGYLLARPLPPEDVATFMASHAAAVKG